MKSQSFTDILFRSFLYLALATALTATLGSLYFSEVRHYLPCNLCWYQRILMYPLVVVIAVGLLRQDFNLPYYVLPLSLVGQGIATYHYLLEKTNIFAAPTSCREGIPCTTPWINWGGFATIPFLSMCAFFIITLLCLIAMVNGDPQMKEYSSSPWFQVIIVVVLVFAAFVVIYNFDPLRADRLTLTVPIQGEMSPVNATAMPTAELSNAAASAANNEGNVSVASVAGTDVTARGQQLYSINCAVCHGGAAQGVPNLGTSLLESPVIQTQSEAEALAFIRTGHPADHPDNTSGVAMPPSGGHPEMSDDDILAIIAFLHVQ